MVYKKYTYKRGKRYGPYFYENKRINGKVVTRYLGPAYVDSKDRRRGNFADKSEVNSGLERGGNNFSDNKLKERLTGRDDRIGKKEFQKLPELGFRNINNKRLDKALAEKSRKASLWGRRKEEFGKYKEYDFERARRTVPIKHFNFGLRKMFLFSGVFIFLVFVSALISFFVVNSLFPEEELGFRVFEPERGGIAQDELAVKEDFFISEEEGREEGFDTEEKGFDEEDVGIGKEIDEAEKGFFGRVGEQVGEFFKGIFGFGEQEIDEEGVLLGPTSSCATLNTAGETYTLTNLVTTAGPVCFTITANNVVLNCQGYTITCTGQTCDGILVNGANNVLIRNCVIQNTAANPFSVSAGIEIRNSEATIHNVQTSGSTGLYLVSTDTNLRNVNVNGSNFNDAFTTQKNVLFERTDGGDGFSYYNLILNNSDIGILPTAISNNDVDFGTDGTRKIIRRWTLTVSVNDDSMPSAPVSGASVQIDDNNAGTTNPVFSGTTDASGKVVTNPLPEIERTVTGTGTISDQTYNPYLVDITKNAYNPIIDSVTMDTKQTMTRFLTVDTTIDACGFTISIPGRTYTINPPSGNYISASGTCITISANNVILNGTDGAGGRREIRHSSDSAGSGIMLSSGYNNIWIKNVQITDNTQASIGTSAGINSISNNNLNISNVDITSIGSYSIWIRNPPAAAEKLINISGNKFILNNANVEGIRIEGYISGNITNNSFSSGGNAGNVNAIHLIQYLGGNPDRMNIIGNRFDLCSGCTNNIGIYIENGNAQNISYNSINALGSGSRGIYLKTANNVLSGNNITTGTTTGTNSYGVYLDSASGNVFTGENITTSGSGANAIYVSRSSNNNKFRDSYLNTPTGVREIFFDALDTSQVWNNNFTNVRRGNSAAPVLISGNPAGFAAGPPASTGRLNMHYYVDANVNFAAGSNEGINIDCTAANSGTCFADASINSNGDIQRQEVLASAFNVAGETSYDAHNFSVDNDLYVQGVNEWGDDLESRNLKTLGNLIEGQRLEFTLRDVGAPVVSFVYPTPASASSITTDSFTIKSETIDVSEHYTFVDFDNSLKFWLTMEDFDAGGNPVDISSNAYVGQLFDDVDFGSGRYGKSSIFDGIGDFIKFSDPTKTILQQNEEKGFTGAAWAKIETTATGSQIFWLLGSDFEMKYSVYYQNLYCLIRGSDGNFIGLNGQSISLADGSWHHYVCKFNPETDLLTWYIDGVKQTEVDAFSFDRFTQDLKNLFIGGNGAVIGTGGVYMNGSVDEVLFFDRALNDSEVSSLYSNPGGASPSVYNNLFDNLPNKVYNFKAYSVDINGNRGNSGNSVTVNVDIAPDVYFDDEVVFDAIDTVNDVATITEPYFDIGAFIDILSGTGLQKVDFIWDAETRNLFDSSTALLMNMDDVSAIGEDYSRTSCSDITTSCVTNSQCNSIGDGFCRTRIFDVSGRGNNGGYYGDNEDPTSSMLSQSGLSGFSAVDCVDGVTTMQCFSADTSLAGSWLMIDLGAGNEKDYVKAKMYIANNYFFGNFNIQYSDVSTFATYGTAATDFNPRLVNQWSEISWNNVGKHRYWRFYLTNPPPGDGGEIMEIEMYSDKVVSGRYGAGFEFDGIDDYINLGVSPTLNNGIDDITISAWVKLDAEIGSQDTNYEIFSNEQNLVHGYVFRIQNTPSGSSRGTIFLRFSRAGNDYSVITPTDTYPNDKQWHHVIGVKSGANGYIYLDGVLVASNTGISSPVDSTTSSKISGQGQPMNGSIDEVFVSGRALSANEVRQLYYSNLRKYDPYKWKLNMNHSGYLDGTHTFQIGIIEGSGDSDLTESRTVYVDIPFRILDIVISNIQRIVLNDVRNVIFNVIVQNGKGNGASDIIVNSQFVSTGPLMTSRPSMPVVCSIAAGAVAVGNFRCQIGIQYYDEPGLWNVNVNAFDNGAGGGGTKTGNRQFVLMSTRAISHPTSTSWGLLNSGETNKYASLQLDNVANNPILNGQIVVTPRNLWKDNTDNTRRIDASLMTANINNPATCGGNGLSDAIRQIITGASLSVFNGVGSRSEGNGIETLNFCITTVPSGLPAGNYQAAGTRSWELTFPDFDPGIPASADKFFIRDSTGNAVAWFGSNGDIALKGSCTVATGATNCDTVADSFIIQNSAGDTKAYISPTGIMCVEDSRGGACANYNNSISCNPATDAFIVQVGGINMSYIDFNGRFCAVGGLYQNQNTLE